MTEAVAVEESNRVGRKACRPLNIGRAFHQVHLYYQVDTLFVNVSTDADALPKRRERRETVVIRSDG